MPQPLTLSSLPLFPLGSVLYPRGLLALRVFEVRYLDMVRKCHRCRRPYRVSRETSGIKAPKPRPRLCRFAIALTLLLTFGDFTGGS